MLKNKISKSKVVFNVTSSNTELSRKESTKKSHKVSYIVPCEKPVMCGDYCDIKHHYQNNVTPEEHKEWDKKIIHAIFESFDMLQDELDELYREVTCLLEHKKW